MSFLQVYGEGVVFSVLAAHACGWVIARLGTETAACGHDPMEKADSRKKKLGLGQSVAACRVVQLFISEIYAL